MSITQSDVHLAVFCMPWLLCVTVENAGVDSRHCVEAHLQKERDFEHVMKALTEL